ncbi:16S rRNA (cytosine(1402)-N(4))-methyltransferase [Candidatus Woesebacteria bacterium RIFOXYB1_FULL_47_31]|uniref:Ribosomal RNA small subunit methyltransferase H n=3 Tax=Candidatus Woeseibacteriota TaxID=1752722 RepID=A0A1F8D556_9BACT|nr:MAG: Ribosomal RNA small subunit methyltransferase H [Candidatus Woesebacteria bacterium GW2011_GWF1_46_13]OGM83754.1 MAG: 16S rRNA (cytosine(1402)-N(4))-methyltransferase [Candidatus Woesebacteria bacterium RIFOXYB1_FULL_47_31]OGM89753.1 MAG: 16S rRNA (cytosine(1402)-N(4))-methyltransferase [Candidatus Woesebacteria bacterium RIFOXYD1_FULL_46_19]
MKKGNYHEPVLVDEMTSALAPLQQARIIDATLGTAGHSLELVKAGADVLGIDSDREMLKEAEERLEEACPTPNQNGLGSLKLTHGNFKDVDAIASREDFSEVDGVLFDLGVSNLQLMGEKRGFSFGYPEAPLDMRIDPNSEGVMASDLLNGLRADQLTVLFSKVLTTSQSRFLVSRVVEQREKKPFETVQDFLRIAKRLKTKKDLNPATLPFLALRMAVNSELENLKEALPKAVGCLKKGGKILVITFHSGEEKIVLDFFHQCREEGTGKILTSVSIRPGEEEISKNPRARSAELWILQKI